MQAVLPPMALAVGMLLAPLAAIGQTAGPTGVWLTQSGDAHVRIAPCGNALCGTIVWLKDPIDPETGRPPTDKRNPNAAQRDTPLLGLQIMHGMTPSGPDRWSGQFYNTDDGQTYSGNLVLLSPSSVKAEGCLLMICMGETWQRVDVPPPKARRKT